MADPGRLGDGPGSVWPFPAGSRRPLREFLAAERAFRRKRSAIFDRSRVLDVSLPCRPDAARRFLPPWLRLDLTRPATLFVASHPRAAFCGPYVEAGLMLPVVGLLGRGVSIVWMVVDDDTALLVGREFLAVPKKMARLGWQEGSTGVAASVERRGLAVVTIEAEARAADSDTKGALTSDRLARPFYDQPTYCIGGAGQLGLVNPVWVWRAKETVAEPRAMRASIRLVVSAVDPLSSLIDSGAAGADHPARLFTVTAHRGRYLCPVGVAGPWWFARTYDSRFR